MGTGGLQPSASRSGLLLECSWPFGKETSGGAGDREAADYGSCWHELFAGSIVPAWGSPLSGLIAETAKRWDLDESATAELAPHLAEAGGVLRRWLSGKNPYGCDFLAKGPTVSVEISLALSKTRARMISSPTAGEHVYEELQPGELAGTADLVIVPGKKSPNPLLVIDHKTGQEDFSEPLKKPQLISLARAAGLAFGVPPAGIVVGVLHARRRGLAAVYSDLAPLKVLADHSRRIFLQLARIGDGTMRPGPWCVGERCPTIGTCPARDAELLEKAGGLLQGLTEAAAGTSARLAVGSSASSSSKITTRAQKLGQLYAVVQTAEKLATAARREIRSEVQGGALPELPDGGYLTIRKYDRENLSKASVVRAYGKVAAERLLEKLRRDGAVETTSVESLAVEGEKGR